MQHLNYRYGTYRVMHPLATLDHVEPLLSACGITRVADITGLDWIGLPVYQAIRPMSRNLSVSQGKGLTRAQAKISAIMEAIELYHAEDIEVDHLEETIGNMRATLKYAPEELPLASANVLNDSLKVAWIAATNLASGTREWVPKELCNLDLATQSRIHAHAFLASSNGLASGNTLEEATLHGLLEVIERDSIARAHDTGLARRVAIGEIGSRIVDGLLRRLEANRVGYSLLDITGPTGVPAFEVELHDSALRTTVGGSGCHISRSSAAIRAITEACQTRLTVIAGTRDDLPGGGADKAGRYHHKARSEDRAQGYRATRFKSPVKYPHSNQQLLASGGSLDVQGINWELIQRIRAITARDPVRVNLTRVEIGVPVVFVVCPGLVFAPKH